MKTNIIEFINKKGYEMINDGLGSGSFGQTVLLKDNSIEELFVCKKYLPQEGLSKEEFFETFRKEIKIMYKINHPNVVRIYNYYLYNNLYSGYILMEYIEGESIDSWFNMYFLQSSNSNQIFRQLIEAFNYIEKAGIIHRDIRESNILITKTDQVKIIDFGLGKNVNEKKLSADSFNKLINRQQMQRYPNEFDEGKYTSKTDMFCLAELYNRLLKKYDVNDFEHDYILQKMMHTDPYKRYSSFEDIIIALDKKDFHALEIIEQDKKIYTSFINALTNSISNYTEKIKIEENVLKIIKGIEQVLESNCLDYHIQANNKLISVFIHGGYKYYSHIKIDVDVVKNFYDWLCSKNEYFQGIVTKNISNKLAAIPIEIEEELPF